MNEARHGRAARRPTRPPVDWGAIFARVVVALAAVFAIGPCGEAPDPRGETAGVAVHARPARPTPGAALPPLRALEARAPRLPPPMPVPSAYFGELELDRLTASVEVEPPAQSSVLLVVVDTLNARHLGLYGYDRDTSPNLDRLAARGITFTNYISNSSWTRPSFTTILTGLPKREHGVELNARPLRLEITTVAERFRRAGYRTAAFVGNPLMLEKWGFGQGFQLYRDTDALELGYFPRDQYVVDEALRWLRRIGDQPFFLMLFLTAPHPPYNPPRRHREFLAQVPSGDVIRHPYKEYQQALPRDAHARIVAAYDGEVRYADEQIGRLLSQLEAAGRQGDAAVVVTADHGEMFGQHGCYLHAYHMYEQTLRVPLVVTSPGLSAGGLYDDRPFTHIDLAPTLLALANADTDAKELPGLSIVELLARPSANRERVLFSQYDAHGVRREAIRKGRLKLVHHHRVEPRAEQDLDSLHPAVAQPDPRDLPSLAWDAERYELFDLVRDPDERRDLSPQYRERPGVAELVRALGLHVGEDAPASALSTEETEALRALGYIDHEPAGRKAGQD